MNTVHDLVHSFYDDLWNRWDDAAVPEVLAPSFEFRGSLGTTTVGLDGWRGYRDAARGQEVSLRAVDTVAELHEAVRMGATRVVTDRPEVLGRAC